MYVFFKQNYISKDFIFNESKFSYANLFETSTSLNQSTSSPFFFNLLSFLSFSIQIPQILLLIPLNPLKLIPHMSLVISILLMLDGLHLFLHSPLLIISQFNLTLTYLFQLLVHHPVQFSSLILNPRISLFLLLLLLFQLSVQK